LFYSISWILTKPPVNQKPAEQKSDSSSLALTSSGKETMLTTKKSASFGRRRRGRGENKRGGASLPPPLQAVVTVHHVFRFVVTTAGAITGTPVTIDGGGLAGALGGTCSVVNSNLTTWASSIRLHRVSIWPSAVAVGTLSPQPEVIWYSPSNAVEKDTSVERVLPAGITQTAPVHSRPPKGSFCGMWMNPVVNVTNILFGLTYVPGGSVIDLDVSFTMSNNMGTLGRVIATGVLGTIYYLYLDGSTRHGLIPAGKPSTF